MLLWERDLEIRITFPKKMSESNELGFPVTTNECWDGSQVSKLLLHASHVALPT